MIASSVAFFAVLATIVAENHHFTVLPFALNRDHAIAACAINGQKLAFITDASVEKVSAMLYAGVSGWIASETTDDVCYQVKSGTITAAASCAEEHFPVCQGVVNHLPTSFDSEDLSDILDETDTDLLSENDITSYLELLDLVDVTSIGKGLLSQNDEFYRSIAQQHSPQTCKFYWHFMSGAATFLPKHDVNILFERLFYSLSPGKGSRVIVAKSFIAYTAWSKDWKNPVSMTNILKANETVASMYTEDLVKPSRAMEGPEDTRVIYNKQKDELYLNFNALTLIGDRQMFGQSIKINNDNDTGINYEKLEPLIQFEHPEGYRAETEKNWVPILIKGELHYIYSLSPLRILKCEVEVEAAELEDNPKKNKSSESSESRPKTSKDVSDYKKVCRVQFNGDSVNNVSQTSDLRSGTNWVEHSPGVFFSFARTRNIHKNCAKAIYRPHFTAMKFRIDPRSGAYADPQIIFISDQITKINDKLFDLFAKKGLSSGKKCEDQTILTPGSISNWTGMSDKENSDVADVIVSINDEMNVMLRIKGFGSVVQKALDSAPSTIKENLIARAEAKMKRFVKKSFLKIEKKRSVSK